MKCEWQGGRGAALGGALCLFLGACAYEGPSLWTDSDWDSGRSSDSGSGMDSDGGSGSCGQEGKACCSSGARCGTGLFCQPLTPATPTCQASPKKCYEILVCADRCGANDTTCGQPCYLASPTVAQKAFDAMKVCYKASCSNLTGSDIDVCLNDHCPTDYLACLP